MEQKLFEEVEKHLLNDEKPSEYFSSNLHKLKNSNLSFILDLEKVEQSKTHHPEGNVLNHMLLVVDAAAYVRKFASDKKALMWSAVFHDIGKIKATKVRKGRITAYDHDVIGSKDAEKILNSYKSLDEELKNKILNMVKYHMHSLYIARNLPFGDTKGMVSNVEMNDMILLFCADKLGRGELSEENIVRVIGEVFEVIEILEKKYKVNLDKSINDLTEILKQFKVVL